MHITEFLSLPKGHAHIDFVDITTDDDTELFIDPCLIELDESPLGIEAAGLISDFADTLYAEMRGGRWLNTRVLDAAHEIHDTRLGYGNGRNGKGKTSDGMRESLSRLCLLANGVPTISQIQDVSVFVEDFAEDCMSDLLTNILHRLLCEYTAMQMAFWDKQPAGFHKVMAWSQASHRWESSEQPFWLVDGQRILLVPKNWVRKNFLFKAHQYLYGVIIERIRDSDGYTDLTKRDIWRNLERDTEHWEYDYVTAFSQNNPDALSDYHNRMLRYYKRAHGQMCDGDIDKSVYGHRIIETA